MAKKTTIQAPVIETVKVSKLKPWSKNPRIKHAVDSIAKSIESFGYLSPIVVQKGTYRVLSGHGRLKALVRKRISEIPVVVADISDKNADLYTIADNKLSDTSVFDLGGMADLLKGLKKLDLSLTGFTSEEVGKLVHGKKEIEEVEGLVKNLRKVTFYAGDDASAAKTAMNDRTLVLVFKTEAQLELVKKYLHRRQAGNEKSFGQIIFETCKNATH